MARTSKNPKAQLHMQLVLLTEGRNYAGILCLRGAPRYVRLCKTGRMRFPFQCLVGATVSAAR